MDPHTLCLASCLSFKFAPSIGYTYRTLDVACLQTETSNCSFEKQWTRICQQKEIAIQADRLKYYNRKKTWGEASKACKSSGGRIAMPKTTEKQMMAKHMKAIGSSEKLFTLIDVWIGLGDLYDNDTFFWEDGSPLTHNDWMDEQPNHSFQGREQNCGTIHVSYMHDGWKARPCDFKYTFLCQY